MSDKLKEANKLKELVPYIAAIGGITFLTIAVYATLHTSVLSLYFYSYLALLIIPIIIVFALISKIEMTVNGTKEMALGGGLLVAFMLTLYGINYISTKYPSVVVILNMIFSGIMFLIIIVALSIVYTIFSNSLTKMEGMPGFIVNFIFYIPCLLNDFIIYLFNQYKITPNIVFILIIIEIMLILMVIYIPQVMRKNSVGVTVLDNPVFLDEVLSLDMHPIADAIHKINPNSLTNTYHNNFTISMWIYLNPTTVTSEELLIFEYYQPLTYFPKITFMNGQYNIYNGQYNVYDGLVPNMTFDLVDQTWNYFVFNHNSNNTVDLFINGALKRSVNSLHNNAFNAAGTQTSPTTSSVINPNIPAKMKIGQKNGLYGSICNILYFTTPLTEREIITTYNLLMTQNPPLHI